MSLETVPLFYLQIMAEEHDTDLMLEEALDGSEGLSAERNRKGKGALSVNERLTMLDEIYDGLLFSWRQNVTLGFTKGSSAISYQLERARLEMIGLSKDHTLIDRRQDPWNYTDYPLDGMGPEASDTVN